MSKSLNELRDEAHANACAKGFHDPEVAPSVPESFVLMHSEISEALEDYRSGWAPFTYAYESRTLEATVQVDRPEFDPSGNVITKPIGIPSEMADVIIRVLDFAGKYKIDLEKAVREKMSYNSTRPTRHGGKRL